MSYAGLILFSLVLWLSAPGAFAEPSLDPARVGRLAEAGAVELALGLIDAHQPPAAELPAWVEWERLRIELLLRQRRWRAVISRADTLPAGAPPEFARWVAARRAEAHLGLGDGRGALAALRGLLWDGEPGAGEAFARWRRLLVEAYLTADLPADAYTALLRYEQDYAPEDADWNRLRARVLLAVERPQEARATLGSDPDPRSRPLYLLAALHSGALAPETVAQEARRAATAKDLDRGVRAQLWAAAAEAARLSGDAAAELEYLAEALAGGALESGRLRVDGVRLWRALTAYGRELGNRRQLLIGNDPQWFDVAGELAGEHPWQAAALYSIPASRRGAAAAEAHRRLSTLIAERDHGLMLLQALYVGDGAPARIADLPETLRQRLADGALADGDFALASRLLGDVSTPPQGQDPWSWELRRARILVLGGDYGGAVAALSKLLQGTDLLSREQADRLMQVLFDLQRVDRHRDALTVFVLLPLDPRDEQLQREVLYWRADSHEALDEHLQAARLYLESAWLPGVETMDPWAQTAQYQAADALVEAGLLADARRIYGRLLAATQDPGRQAVIRSRLQQLALKEGKQRTEDQP